MICTSRGGEIRRVRRPPPAVALKLCYAIGVNRVRAIGPVHGQLLRGKSGKLGGRRFVKNKLIILGKYGLGLGLLAYVIWKNWSPPGGLGIAQALQRPVQIGPLAVASALLCSSVVLTFVRWFLLVRAQELPFTLGNAVRLGLMGYALSTFLPGSVGGDTFK